MFHLISSRFTVVPLLSLVTVLSPAMGGHISTPPRPGIVIGQSVATSQEPALVPLTPELITNYLAVRKVVFPYLQSHRDLLAAAPRQMYHFYLTAPGDSGKESREVSLPDFDVLAKKDSAVAEMFTHHHLSPAQFGPITITLKRALFAAAVYRAKKWTIKDTNSVVSKNMALVGAHLEAFAGSGLEVTVSTN